MEENNTKIIILGGGVAGLAAGFYAKRAGIPLTIFEKADRVGGNCITLRHGDFLFDSGAHRVHDRDPEITEEIKALLGDELLRVEAPSKIYHQGRFIDFPLSPLNLFLHLGFFKSLHAIFDLIVGRLTIKDRTASFENFAVSTYGRTIAEKFLLGYSEKLWGAPVAELSPTIAGRRLKGLDVRTFICEAIFGKKAKTKHLEGMGFYYPRFGFGAIPARMAAFCGSENIFLKSGVTRIVHDNSRLLSIEINGSKAVDVKAAEVVSTIPINEFIRNLEPKAPAHIIEIAKTLRFRHMALAVLFVDRPSFTKNATIYLPDSDVSFTRIYEPKNRSTAMAPQGKTCLVLEIPCQKEDVYWTMAEKKLLDLVRGQVVAKGWLKADEISASLAYRFENAYPILEKGYEEKLAVILEYLKTFTNLHSSGRNGLFAYSWIHDMFLSGKEIVGDIVSAKGAPSRE